MASETRVNNDQQADPERQIVVDDWRPVRDALKHAYDELGMDWDAAGRAPGGRPVLHWNLAVLVYEYARRPPGRCLHCQTPLDFYTAFRCFDCKAALCENCITAHCPGWKPSHGR